MRKLIVILVLFFPSVLLAQVSPDEIVQSMFNKYKEEGSPHAFLQFIHWPTAYKELTEEQKSIRGIKSPEELQAQYESFYASAGDYVSKQILPKIANETPEKKSEVQEQLKLVALAQQTKIAALTEDIKASVFEAGEAKIDRDTAVVPMTTKTKGEVRNSEVTIRFIEGRWLLPNFDATGLFNMKIVTNDLSGSGQVASSSSGVGGKVGEAK